MMHCYWLLLYLQVVTAYFFCHTCSVSGPPCTTSPPLEFSLALKCNSKAHFARAVVEGITFSLVQVLYALETTYHPVNSIYASGAITQSAWWMQLLADVSGRPVIYQDAPDASALGAAMLGMYATGVISSLGQSRQFFTASTVFHPDLGLHTVYSRQYQAYTRLYPQLKDCF